MAELLNVVSSYALTDITESEINTVINEIIEKSKNNVSEISELTLECTSLLTSAENKSRALSEQGVFKRLLWNVTGKNKKIQNAIMNDNTNALYAAQATINGVMRECTYNRELLLAVNDRVSDLYFELKENQIETLAQVAMIRKAFVAFYQEFLKNQNLQVKEIKTIRKFAEARCPKCNSTLLSWQRICPECGNIHELKTEVSSKNTQNVLSLLSEALNRNTSSNDILWDMTAQKTDAVLKKVKLLAEIGKLNSYSKDLESDINILMKKCRDAEFQIAVVGVMKAGKSFLMNALIGAEIASVEVNPETAALTKFRSANGYYVKVKFHDETQWDELKSSVLQSESSIDGSQKRDSFAARLSHPSLKEMENKYIGQKEEIKDCKNLEELREQVRIYTSSKSLAHILVSEIEVGIDKSVFNMPGEVVFVDTPGLKDPVKYRSDITEKYIKQANAVLVALKPGPFTAEGIEIVTTVLDKTDKDKTIIVGTQSDLNNEDERSKYVSNWKEKLVEARRYQNERDINSRIVLTSAKMELLLKKWNSLSIEEKENEDIFSNDDYNSLEKYAKDTFRKRSFAIENISKEESDLISNATGIPALRKRLEDTLIANYRKLKVNDIVKAYELCRNQIIDSSIKTIEEKENYIATAKAGAERINAEIERLNKEKSEKDAQMNSLKQDANKLTDLIRKKISKYEKKEM